MQFTPLLSLALTAATTAATPMNPHHKASTCATSSSNITVPANDYTYAIEDTIIQKTGDGKSINRLSFLIRTSAASGLEDVGCVATNYTTGEIITSDFRDSAWYSCGTTTGRNIFNFSYQSDRQGILLQQAASQEGALLGTFYVPTTCTTNQGATNCLQGKTTAVAVMMHDSVDRTDL